ncbi:EEF1A lysine methyltransferase 3-like [Carcharodon carcharias]|uniref:EEF1A lysine methyltransferase 3-like n=1 Tax=Carcharodon carcharias TaxID=13397 RepID=UPI001B7E893B|nr:EEF1A lysine methyltransferase 3-like [Carcharodon carcharias]
MTTTQYREYLNFETPENENRASKPSIRRSNFEFCGFNLRIIRFMDAEMGVSSYVWESGIVLCRYFEKENISFTGKKVIELGSGTGIVGILATLLGGTVTMTDQPEILKQINNNISINIPFACRHRLKVCALTWGENQTDFATDYDVILGSDLVYSSSSYPALVDTLRYLCSQGTTIYLASEFRTGNGSLPFHEVILPTHFNCQIVDRLETKYIAVYKLTKLHSPDNKK